jgi:integrase/recombinase XerD
MSAPLSPLAEAARDYLIFRRALGHQLEQHGRLLDQFVAYLAEHEHGTVTVNAALAWAGGDATRSRSQVAVRLSAVRSFATYQAAFDPATQIPPKHLVAGGVQRRTPYVFSTAQIAALMAAAARLRPPLRAASFQTLIGLMAATGLRTGEALRLDRDDVDTEGGLLLIRYSKYGKTRRIPVHASTSSALAHYAVERDRLCPHTTQDSFLISPSGGRMSNVSETFRPLLADVGIAVPAGRRAPRLHDMRHAFAVATLRDWHAANVDVQQALPGLSAYLGHVNPDHTYWYVQAIPELMAVLVGRLEQFLADQP